MERHLQVYLRDTSANPSNFRRVGQMSCPLFVLEGGRWVHRKKCRRVPRFRCRLKGYEEKNGRKKSYNP